MSTSPKTSLHWHRRRGPKDLSAHLVYGLRTAIALHLPAGTNGAEA